MDRLSIGQQVDIQRSDGRVHAAVISSIDEDGVTVEWFEGAETKGKRTDLAQLLALNPTLATGGGAAAAAAKANKAASKPPAAKRGSSNNSVAAAKKSSSSSSSSAAAPAPAAASRSKSNSVVQSSSNSNSSSISSARPSSSASSRSNKSKASDASARRVSSKGGVVNKVEEIAAKREQRRAKMDQQREKREKRGGQANPNHEFEQMVEGYRDSLDIRPIAPNGPVNLNKITVCVRKRPLNRKEVNSYDIDVITIPDGETTLVHECKSKVDLTKVLDNHVFRFDHSFDESTDNSTVYHYTAKPLVETIFEQGMCTCFAYGQTGSGKTFTMSGEGGAEGIYAMAARDVFRIMRSPKYKDKKLRVSVSFFEIYGGKVYDLLNKQKRLRVLEDAKQQVQVVGLAEHAVHTLEEVIHLLKAGNTLRASGSTSANQNSSRSHAIFQLILRPEKGNKLHGKFSLIDLAGNERGADTANADRQTRLEGAEINKSLLALKETIRSMGRRGAYVPFRASTLTQVLKDSFTSPRASTCMVAMVSPGLHSCEHSLNTLRYADRVKELAPDKPSKADQGDGERDELDSSLVKNDLRRLHMSLRASGGETEQEADELFGFHAAVSELQEAEERMVDEHRSQLEWERSALADEEQLLAAMDSVDADAEKYCQKLEKLIDQKMAKLASLRSNLSNFRKQMAEEEKASKNVKKLRYV